MYVSGLFLKTSATLFKLLFAVEVRLEELKSKFTLFSFKTTLIPSPTRSTSAPGRAVFISRACLSILLPITPPATPPTIPPKTAPIVPLPPLPILLPKIPPKTAPLTVPIATPLCVLLEFFTASQLVNNNDPESPSATTYGLLNIFII